MSYSVVHNYTVVLPGQPQYQWLEEYAYHRRREEEARAGWKVENVRFEHDPQWNTRFLIIQCAHDGNHPVWKAANYVVRYSFPAASIGANFGNLFGMMI